MNKNIIKAMYECCISNDEVHKNMSGVHFEKERCYATDTSILAVYNCGSEKFDGKTIDVNGEPVKGKFPPVDRAIPKKLVNPLSVDFRQLRSACSWWTRQSSHHANDRVVLGGTPLNIRYLSRLLYLFHIASELGSLSFYLNTDNRRPVVAVSESLTVLLMPYQIEDESEIDESRIDCCACTVSYANLINTYAIESNRPKPKKTEPMSWL